MTQGLDSPPKTILRPEIRMWIEFLYFPLTVYLSDQLLLLQQKTWQPTFLFLYLMYFKHLLFEKNKNKITNKFLAAIV